MNENAHKFWNIKKAFTYSLVTFDSVILYELNGLMIVLDNNIRFNFKYIYIGIQAYTIIGLFACSGRGYHMSHVDFEISTPNIIPSIANVVMLTTYGIYYLSYICFLDSEK